MCSRKKIKIKRGRSYRAFFGRHFFDLEKVEKIYFVLSIYCNFKDRIYNDWINFLGFCIETVYCISHRKNQVPKEGAEKLPHRTLPALLFYLLM